MKNKNPLYVVKGKEVQEASSMLDLLIKKFNLEPLVMVLKNIFNLLLEQVENYAMFLVIKNFLDEILQKLIDLGKKFGLVTA
jgi:hypothetical protein